MSVLVGYTEKPAEPRRTLRKISIRYSPQDERPQRRGRTSLHSLFCPKINAFFAAESVWPPLRLPQRKNPRPNIRQSRLQISRPAGRPAQSPPQSLSPGLAPKEMRCSLNPETQAYRFAPNVLARDPSQKARARRLLSTPASYSASGSVGGTSGVNSVLGAAAMPQITDNSASVVQSPYIGAPLSPKRLGKSLDPLKKLARDTMAPAQAKSCIAPVKTRHLDS